VTAAIGTDDLNDHDVRKDIVIYSLVLVTILMSKMLGNASSFI